MTAKYVHFTQQDVLRRYRGFSPMDRRPVPGLRLQARRNGTRAISRNRVIARREAPVPGSVRAMKRASSGVAHKS